MEKQAMTLNREGIVRYVEYLREQERTSGTILKYERDLEQLRCWLNGRRVDKETLIDWKETLLAHHVPTSVNGMLASINGYLRYRGRVDLCIRPIRIQRALFLDEQRELEREEYCLLVEAAQRLGNQRLALVLQTICATGIRVSELQYITVEALRIGRAEVENKGKRRTVFLPERLRELLWEYLRTQTNTAGAVFVTRNGKPLDRSNIWREMKSLCQWAGIEPKKVFPHNLRHLFARTYYASEKDLAKLADLLGHSNINTTRIYIAESGTEHARQLEELNLVITKSSFCCK